MAGIEVSQITNASIYVAGASLVGMAEEVGVPEIMAITSEYKGLGMASQIKLPTGGFQPAEFTMKLKSYYPKVMAKAGNPYKGVQIQVRSSIDTYGNGGLVSQKKLVTLMTVLFTKLPSGGSIKNNERAEINAMGSVLYFKQTVDDEDIIEIDFMNNIFKLNGDDILADWRANHGQ
jgi:P2 family phage contractile tail tube protein